MDIYKFRKQLRRYLKGTANETENAIVEAWYKSYQNESNQQLPQEERERIKNNIHAGIKAAIAQQRNRSWYVYRIAASVLLVSGLSLAAYFVIRNKLPQNQTFTIIQTHAGEVRQITLPDSSVIWVNAASRIRVPASFNEDIRQVYLDEGEAFFKVKHDATKPFRVNAAVLKVQVLGTSFNISAYKQMPFIKVVVATGKVSVSHGDKTLSVLTPGQQLTYLPAKDTYSNEQVNIENSQSWKDGNTSLNQAGFDELALVYKNLFNINLHAGNARAKGYRFTIRIKQNIPPDETLKAISQLHNTHFRKEGHEVTLY
ncbi:FecR family protein [Mucilaginibacter kameinonensis]|uniref:FecR family protein n=1 Tax=Mucilaginibacter kameinonensis TaxID=452286 RepID=UPI000EF85008|nr:FecR family protein [Mucilaginibacter kameinonensis]